MIRLLNNVGEIHFEKDWEEVNNIKFLLIKQQIKKSEAGLIPASLFDKKINRNRFYLALHRGSAHGCELFHLCSDKTSGQSARKDICYSSGP